MQTSNTPSTHSTAKVQFPLRSVLIIPFLLQIFAAVGLVGWLSFRNGEKAVNQLADQLRGEVGSRVEEHLQSYLEIPQQLAQLNTQEIQADRLDFDDFLEIQRHFWHQIQVFSEVREIYIGDRLGYFLGVLRQPDDTLALKITENFPERNFYVLNSRGEAAELFKSDAFYDARTRPWYQNAVEKGELTWTPVYTFVDSGVLGISVTQPLFDSQNEFLGVLAVSLNLGRISNFLESIEVSSSGEIFILDRSGSLIASSTGEKPFRLTADGKAEQILAASSSNLLIRETANYLLGKFPDLGSITQAKKLEFSLKDQKQFVQIIPAQNNRGIDWLIVIVVPESDFMAKIHTNNRATVLLCLLALVGATIIGILTSRWISRPILHLTRASEAISQGDLDRRVQIRGIKELTVLANAFNGMAAQLKASFEALQKSNGELERRVEERTAELNVAKQEAEFANLAKSEFLANMSHELRTPLNGILGYAQILQRANLENSHHRGVDIILHCGSHLLNLINDILDLSKIEARKMELNPKDFHFLSFLLGIAEMIRIRAKHKGIEFAYVGDSRLPAALVGDEKRLGQVLINLLGNAVKFTDTGGVTFTVEVIGSTPQTAQLRFSVEDTGIGMTDQQIEKIFQPFEQVCSGNRRGEGTGLGLTISLQLLAMMESTIEVSSVPGRGSRFWFDLELPIARDWVAAVTQVELGKIIGYEGQRRKILVVDDKSVNRDVVVEILTPLGFDCDQATNGEEALTVAEQFEPDLMITDLVMPILDGFEMTRRFRQGSRWKDLIIIASSASVLQEDQFQSLEAGCNDFLPKPVEIEKLLNYLQKYLRLEWIYEAETDVSEPTPTGPESTIFPPAEQLQQLYQAAQIGDIDAIETEAKRFQELDGRYQQFGDHILALADEFDDAAILALLEKAIAQN